MADSSRGDWQCPNPQCYNHTNFPEAFVYGSSVNCKKCGTGRAASRPGDWCCPNPQCINNTNCVYGSKSVCPKCGCPKPPAAKGQAPAGAAMPGMPGMQGMLGMQCMQGVQGLQGVQGITGMQMAANGPSPVRDGDWHCANPDCKNHSANIVYASKVACPLCGMPKPDVPVKASPNPMAAVGQPFAGLGTLAPQVAVNKGGRPGDWNCPNSDCKNHINNIVYGSKSHCPLCNTPKPQMGASVVGMRPGDWHCPNPDCKNHTANIIYASKTQCPLCNATNPYLDERQRSRSPPGMPF